VSYQSSQFFRIDQSRPAYTGAFVSDNALNKPFLFPDKNIRVPWGRNGANSIKILEKGYIRRINEFDDGDNKPLVCRFQFNPQYLNQDANFASGITHPIYQPIEQLKQPIASMTNFAFRLTFDRTMELNNGFPNPNPRNIASDNPWEKNGPEQVGVLHDISALYRVIGQGISDRDIQSAISRSTENLAASEIARGGEPSADADARFEEAARNAVSFFRDQGDVNVGNTSFILPFPVRIVFSSLYIVEGFVTQTSLEVLKFNSSYVPMIANVTLTVNALYIGFAKKNTFFTHVLEKSAQERRNERLQRTEAQNKGVETLRRHFNKLHVKHIVGQSGPRRSLPGPGVPSNAVRFGQLFRTPPALLPEEIRNHNVFASPTDWLSPSNFSSTRQREERGLRPVTVTTGNEGDVAALFDSGEITQLTYKWKSSIFGPIKGPSRSFNNAASVEDVLNNPVILATNASGSRYISSQKSVTVTTKKGWLDLSTPSESESVLIRLPNRGFLESLDQTTWWLLLLEAECTVVINGLTYDAVSFSPVVLERNNTLRSLSGIVNFDWSRYYASVSDAAAANSNTGTVGVGIPGEVSQGTIKPVGPRGLPLSTQIIGLPFPI